LDSGGSLSSSLGEHHGEKKLQKFPRGPIPSDSPLPPKAHLLADMAGQVSKNNKRTIDLKKTEEQLEEKWPHLSRRES
jgi:hypothetical protein